MNYLNDSIHFKKLEFLKLKIMNDKYLHKTIEEIAAEKEFIDWVKNNQHNEVMDTYLTKYPDQLDKINQAIYLVNAVHFAKTKDVSDEKITQLWNKIENSIAKDESNTIAEQKPTIQRKINYKPWLAAAIMIGILTSAFLFFRNNDTQIQTAFAQKIEKTLPDNSKIWINAGSSISYDNHFEGKGRKVKLTGEAQFQVTKGIGQFVVETSHGKVTVLGTKFNIRDRDQSFVLECFEGKVKIDIQGKSKIVKGGHAIQYDFNTQKFISYIVTPDGNADWINGEIKFEARPMAEVIHEIERQFDVKIKFKTDISKSVYSGFFKTDHLENALQSVFWPMKKQYKINGKQVLIY